DARTARSREKVLGALDRLEAELQPSGYLVGERFSVADLTAAALLAPVVFLPPEFPYAPPGPLPAPVARWREAFAGRRASHWAAGRGAADRRRTTGARGRPRPAPPLYPRDEAARRRALALEDFFDEEVGHAVRTAIVGPLFAHDPVSAGSVLTTGMGAGARRAVRAVLPAFRAFYKLRHGIDDAAIAVAPARVRAGLDRIAAELG